MQFVSICKGLQHICHSYEATKLDFWQLSSGRLSVCAQINAIVCCDFRGCIRNKLFVVNSAALKLQLAVTSLLGT